MRFPKVLLAVPIVAAGILMPALTRPLDTPPPGVIGMGHDGFVVNGLQTADEADGRMPTITIHAGQRLTFENNSRWIHIVGPGENGLMAAPGMGSMTPLHMMQQNEIYATLPWNTPGNYLITCTVHPDMNAKVVVLP